MVPFDMPLDARLALAKMSVIYEREIGSKIKMSRDEDIVSLINFAVDSFNEEIIKYLDTFTRLLGPGELRQLAAQGANIYRGALVPEDESFNPDYLDSNQGEGVKMYRGVPVSGSNASKTASRNSPNAEQKPPKGKRVYRGRVIEE
jgi:hypothetical protein